MLKLLRSLIKLFFNGGKTASGKTVAKNISKGQKLREFEKMLHNNPQYKMRYNALMSGGKTGKQEHIKFLKDVVNGRKKPTDYVKPTGYERKWDIEHPWHKKPGW